MSDYKKTSFFTRYITIMLHLVLKEMPLTYLRYHLQKIERESPVAFIPGMNRRSFEGGGDEGEAERRPKRLLTTTSGSAMMRKDVLSE